MQPVTAADFFQRARGRLSLAVPAGLTDASFPLEARGDLDLDPAIWEKAGVSATRPAAVLVPIVERAEPTVLLTLRTAELASHAGQVAFPGGKIDPGDASPLAAALRETEEEIGVGRQLIEPIGYLDLFLTFSGFRILPAVARLSPDYQLTLNPREVSEAFEVPLAFLMDEANHQRQSREARGVTRHFFAMPFEQRNIWGVTAGIVRNLYERIYKN
jgi:8-oxo-dGTP pyrophosphatase MutT (NUDIX family)